MSYDMEFVYPNTDEVVMMKDVKHFHGGTYRLGEDRVADFNITYNYSKFYYERFGELGIRHLYGKTAKEVELEIAKVVPHMDLKTTENYWDATEGNARAALIGLMFIAQQVPSESILRGD